MNDKREFLKILTGLTAIFKANLSAAALEAYWVALRNFTIDQFRTAAEKIIKTRVYNSFPMPAEFIRAIEGDARDNALLIGQRLVRWAEEHGRFDPPALDEVAQKALDLAGGYRALCAMRMDESQWWVKRFVEIYRAGHAARIYALGDAGQKILPDQKQITGGKARS